MKALMYLDLFSRRRSYQPGAVSKSGGPAAPPPSGWWIFGLYVALLLGILTKVLVDYLSTGKPVNAVRVILAVVASISAFPGVYKEAMESSGPNFVQLCVAFTTGYGLKAMADTEIPSAG